MRIALLGIVVLGCGGQWPDAGDGGDGGADIDTGADWTTCSSPSGQRVCYGPNHCPFNTKVCLGCINGFKISSNDSTTLGYCAGNPRLSVSVCSMATDGQVCFEMAHDAGFAWVITGEFDLGLLFLRNGAADRVRYADFGLFDGTPLPEPTTCPSLGAARICGGNCGGCAPDQFCHGRSPLHPFGFCVPTTPRWCTAANPTACPGGSGCFIFKVQPAAQPLADNEGLCMPKAACLELATSYPGGGTCSGI